MCKGAKLISRILFHSPLILHGKVRKKPGNKVAKDLIVPEAPIFRRPEDNLIKQQSECNWYYDFETINIILKLYNCFPRHVLKVGML